MTVSLQADSMTISFYECVLKTGNKNCKTSLNFSRIILFTISSSLKSPSDIFPSFAFMRFSDLFNSQRLLFAPRNNETRLIEDYSSSGTARIFSNDEVRLLDSQPRTSAVEILDGNPNGVFSSS